MEMWDEPEGYVPPRSAEELLERYGTGERYFREADLQRTELRYANLQYANLQSANLNGANLQFVNFQSANLNRAGLQCADFRCADLQRANLQSANLNGANLSGAKLQGTDFQFAHLVNTNLSNTNIESICEQVHRAPYSIAVCMVDWRTVARSLKAPNLHSTLLKLGIPNVFATYMIDCAKSMDSMELFTMLQSVFISYGGPDEDFAEKLRDALKANGVNTFFFPDDAIPGQRLHRVMFKGVNEHDRIVLICSKSSLTRPGVVNEIEQTIQREAREGGKEVLIPIRLDGFVFGNEWAPDRPDLRQNICDRVVANFRGTDTDEDKFQTAVGKLLLALRKDAPTS